MLCHESWTLESEAFDGAWILGDCCGSIQEATAVTCMARMLAVRVVANAVRRKMRSEDIREDVGCTRAYLDDLALGARDACALGRLLGALTPFDPVRIAEELLAICVTACADGLDGTARSLAELAYDTASAHRLDDLAQGAASALSRCAALQECPRIAGEWRVRARAHRRRASFQRFAGVAAPARAVLSSTHG